MLNRYFNIQYFLVSFLIGMFFVYITSPIPDIIIKYPTPDNIGKIIYKDSADMCYVYDLKEVVCPKFGVISPSLQTVDNNIKNSKGIFDYIKRLTG